MPDDITVLSSLATREAYLELLPQFEAAKGCRVATTWAGTVDIMKRMTAGEVFDLLISSSASIAELGKQGKIAGAGINLAKSGIGIGVRKGAPKPDVSTPEAFKRALLDARSVGLSTGPSGVYLLKLFERLGNRTMAGEFAGELAESWKPAADFKSYTIKLRPGVKFAPAVAIWRRKLTASGSVL